MSTPSDTFTISQIGTLTTGNGFTLTVDEPYRQGLDGLEGFSHVIVLWVAHQTDEGSIVLNNPYVEGPERPGVFSTRSASRPNRLGISVAPVVSTDFDRGQLTLAWIDTLDQTPVVDVKPYFPSSDRVSQATTPDWCSNWPQNLEESATFDWDSAFN